MHQTKLRSLSLWTSLMALVAVTAGSQKPTETPTWSPDKTLIKNLSATIKIEGYALQPPKDYKMQRANAPEGMKGFAWVGAPRDDGTQPTLLLALITPPAGEISKTTLDQLADKLLAGVKRRRMEWQQGKTERGIINGMTFVRINWTGTEPTQKRKMQGLIYVSIDGNTVIQMTSQDVVSQAKLALPVAEASIRTFRKQ